jgi:hypothetical protein
MDLIASLKTHLSTYTSNMEDSLKAELHKFVEFVTGEEAKLKDAIAYVESKGLVVSRPAAPEPAAPSA